MRKFSLSFVCYSIVTAAIAGVSYSPYHTGKVNSIWWNYYEGQLVSVYKYETVDVLDYVDSYGVRHMHTETRTTRVEPTISESTAGEIVVPSQISGNSITGITVQAFRSCGQLTCVTIPSSIKKIGGAAFCECGKLERIVFQGNAPVGDDSVLGPYVHANCTAYVKPSSTGWGVNIPGTWRGIKIEYMKWIKFHPNGGTVTAQDQFFIDPREIGTMPTPTRIGYVFDGWYTAASGGTKLSTTTIVSENTTCYAHWTANNYTIAYNANGGSGTTTSTVATYDENATLATNGFTCYAKQFVGWSTEADGQVVYSAGQKVSNLTVEPNGTITLYAVWETLIVPSTQVSAIDGTTFCGDSYTVTLSCQLDGATIYYTTNGVTPRLSATFAYTEPIVIYGSAEIVAIAVKDGERSGYTRVTITQITPDAPVIVPADGTEFRSATCEVAISCATDGAEIYYTIDGSTPQRENGTKYTAPFTITDTATVKAVAVGGPFRSEVVTATISKRSLSLAEAAGMIELTFDTDENAPWCPIVDASAASGFAAQSGTIGMDTSTWMETSVRGVGTFSFKWRVECEMDDSGGATWDRLVVYTNAVEAARIDGVTEWQNVSFVFGDEGKHTIRWEFVKDDYDEEGATFADNAWVSGVSWVSDDPIPAIEESSELGWALSFAQDKEKLSAKLTSVAAYKTFRTWVDGKGLGHATVAASPNAWLSYALDVPGLISNTTPLASEDVMIDAIVPSNSTLGTFDLVVGIAGAEIGTAARLAEVFDVEGAMELSESGFSSEVLTVTLQRTADGKVKATVAPVGSPSSFFMRVKVK